MIYNMSRYGKLYFLSFFDVRASKWLQNVPEGENVLNIVF